jgi:hypothetical protein
MAHLVARVSFAIITCAGVALSAGAAQAAEILAEGSPQPRDAALAPTGDASRYLLAWLALTDDGEEVHTRLVDDGAHPVTTPVRVSDVQAPDDRLAEAASPELVYDKRRDRFLLTYVGYWFVGQFFQSAIYAQMLDAQGHPLGSAVRVTRTMRYRDSAARIGTIAHDAVSDSFLVAWAAPSRRGPVRARLIAPDGSPRGEAMRLSDRRNEISTPAVALNLRTRHFLVVWGHASRGERMYGRAVTARGRRGSGSFRIPLATPAPDRSAYDDVRRRAALDPSLAFDSQSGRFGLTWSSEAASREADYNTQEILAQRLTSDGRSPVGRGIRVTPGFLTGGDQDSLVPRIAYGRGDAAFTIVWEYSEGASGPACVINVIYARRLSRDWRRVNPVEDPLSTESDPGDVRSNAGGSLCHSLASNPVVVGKRGRRGFVAAWDRTPYVLGVAR